MNLTRATSHEIGSALDRAGVTGSYDDDGDIRVRFRSSQQPWTDVVFYEFDAVKADFSMRGQFLNGRAVPQANGMTRWEVPFGGLQPTAVAQKVVTVFLMPRPGAVGIQIHASIAPAQQPDPMHIKLVPGRDQVSRIESAFPGFVGRAETRDGSSQFWMSGGVIGKRVDEDDLLDMLCTTFDVGLEMFEGPFTGWMYTTDV